MKNPDLYINPNGNKRKLNFEPLVDFLLMFAIGGGIVTIILCIPYF